MINYSPLPLVKHTAVDKMCIKYIYTPAARPTMTFFALKVFNTR